MINNSKGVAISVTPLLFASWFNIDGRVYIDDNYDDGRSNKRKY